MLLIRTNLVFLRHYLWGLFLSLSPSFIQVTPSKYGIIIFLHETGREVSHLLHKFQHLILALISAFLIPGPVVFLWSRLFL